MQTWVAASKENALPGKSLRFQSGALQLSLMITGTIERCSGDWISFRIIRIVPPDAIGVPTPGELMVATIKQCEVEEIVEEVPSPLPKTSTLTDRELNFQLVQIRRADDLRNQIRLAQREGRALDVFCMRLELGDYLTT